MANAVITFKLMPESPEVDLKAIEEQGLAIAKKYGALGHMQAQQEPIAFGLKAVLILAMYRVDGLDAEKAAEEMGKIPGVQHAEVARMDLALG